MVSWDPHGVERLESIRGSLVKVGLIDFAHEAAVEVWRANRDRHEPEELFDNSLTLGVQSTINLANRVFAHVSGSARWLSAGVRASRKHTATVLHVGGLDVRLVKAPHRAARRPNFVTDFDWHNREARQAAAARNHASYGPPARRPNMETLFEVDHPGARQAAQWCRDVFLVWGAELTSGLTAGWLGLPTTSADRWLAVTPLWWDEPSSAAVITDNNSPLPGDGPAFGDKPAPKPSITLKPRRKEGNAQ
jgi:hypothetical protein